MFIYSVTSQMFREIASHAKGSVSAEMQAVDAALDEWQAWSDRMFLEAAEALARAWKEVFYALGWTACLLCLLFLKIMNKETAFHKHTEHGVQPSVSIG